jgi:hypothetical protein
MADSDSKPTSLVPGRDAASVVRGAAADPARGPNQIWARLRLRGSMAQAEKLICPSCGFANTPPLASNRCASCGAKVDDLRSKPPAQREEIERRFRQEGFSLVWFGIAFAVMAVMTAALVMGLPIVIPLLDFEGSAGMLVSIPVWFMGGLLIGLISPGRTYIEPMVAVFLIAVPTAFILHLNQTVKTMPAFMYVLMSALGMLFTLIGSYLGERIQLGPSPQSNE